MLKSYIACSKMLSRLQSFLTGHRRKIFTTGVVIGGSYMAFKYAQKKLFDSQERQAKEFLEKSRRVQHFESTERTCNHVILGMGAELMQAIIKECCTEELLRQLRENPPNKIELWEEMKIVAFTRLTTFIYASSMLVVALRIQLNVLGGYLYHATTTDMGEQENTTQIADDLKQQYLSLIRHFIQDGGLIELVHLIRSKVLLIMRDIPLTKQLSLADTEQLFWSLQMSLNTDPQADPCSKMAKYVLPSQLSDYIKSQPLLEKMFNETLDLLESEDARTVCCNNISRGFSLAVDAMAENYGETIVSSTSAETAKITNAVQENGFFNINTVQIPVARLIPIVNGLTARGFDSKTRPQNLATSLLTFYVISEKCKILGANVYETFSAA